MYPAATTDTKARSTVSDTVSDAAPSGILAAGEVTTESPVAREHGMVREYVMIERPSGESCTSTYSRVRHRS